MVLRTAVGGGLGVGAQHSQMLEAWLTHVPGLKVVVPEHPVRRPRACSVSCHGRRRPLRLHRAGAAAGRVAACSTTAPVAARCGRRQTRRAPTSPSSPTAARSTRRWPWPSPSAADGPDVEVLDLRSLAPLDADAVLESVGRTRRGRRPPRGGGDRGIRRRDWPPSISEALFGRLLAPVLRVGAVPAPLPYAKSLETLALPGRHRLLGCHQPRSSPRTAADPPCSCVCRRSGWR